MAFTCHAFAVPEVIVDLRGVKGPLLENIEANLSLYQHRKDKSTTDEDLEFYLERAVKEIQHAAEVYGYYEPRITPHIEKNASQVYARFDINPGTPVRIKSIYVQFEGAGKEKPEIEALLNDFPLKIGQRLQHPKYEEAKVHLIDGLNAHGFFDADFREKQILIYPNELSAEIILIIDTGEQYHFGDILYPNSTPLAHSFINRYAKFSPGMPYNQTLVNEFHTDLAKSAYFSAVNVTPDPQHDHLSVPVITDVTARLRNQYDYALGFGTDTGPRGRIQWQRRYLNPQGDQLAANVQASPRDNYLDVVYTIPGEYPAADANHVTLARKEETIDNRYARSFSAKADRSKKFTNWTTIIALEFLRETYRDRIEVETREVGLVLPSIQFTKEKNDNDLNPQKGYLFSFEVLAGYDALLSSTSLAQTNIKGRLLIPYFENFRFLSRLDFGATVSQNQEKVPLTLRYFAGGDQSIRGFGYETLGPTATDGLGRTTVIGGQYLTVASIETWYQLESSWGLAAFVDAGNAWNQFDLEQMQSGAGVGVRYSTPVGPFRFYFAHPLTSAADGWHIHVIFGSEI